MKAGVLVYPHPNKCKAPISSLIVTFVSDPMYPSFPTQCTFVGLLDDAPTGSRTQSIINQKAENHKEGLDTFQSMFEGVTNKKNVSLLQAAVSVHIRSFSGTKSSRVNEAIAVETDVLYSELKNNI